VMEIDTGRTVKAREFSTTFPLVGSPDRPFTSVTRVQIPSGTLAFFDS
jgi:hypothetical protein